MIKALSNNFLQELVDQKIIKDEDKSIYEYGIEISLSYLANFLSMAVISIIMGMLIEYIVFISILLPLKAYTGGYHASNYKTCFVASCMIVTLVLVTVKYAGAYFEDLVLIIIMALSGALIYALGPIEDKNKPLTKNEYDYFKTKIKFILIIEFIGALIVGLIGLKTIMFIFFCSFVVTLLISLAGVIKVYWDNIKWGKY